MSEEFKITGPGRYQARNGEIITLKKWNPVDIGPTEYAWQDNMLRLWTDSGAYFESGKVWPLDIIARVDVPQPDAQDRIVGVESPKPLDPLARLEAWKSNYKDRGFLITPLYNIFKVELRTDGDPTVQICGNTIAEAITKALDIAEGIK